MVTLTAFFDILLFYCCVKKCRSKYCKKKSQKKKGNKKGKGTKDETLESGIEMEDIPKKGSKALN